jgi:hypothetical protein
LGANGRCANRINHSIDPARVLVPHESDDLLFACVDDFARTPAQRNLQPLRCYITDDDLFDALGASRGESAKTDWACTKDQQALVRLYAGQDDGAD